jgi:cytochrome c peroxidase
MGDGGVAFLRRTRAAGMEGWRRLHDVPTLRLWRGSSLPHAGDLANLKRLVTFRITFPKQIYVVE